MRGQLGHDKRPHVRSSSSFLGMDAWMTLQLNAALIRKLRRSLVCLTYIDKLSMGVFTIRHWQSFGRLVQKSDVCTVGLNRWTRWHFRRRTCRPFLTPSVNGTARQLLSLYLSQWSLSTVLIPSPISRIIAHWCCEGTGKISYRFLITAPVGEAFFHGQEEVDSTLSRPPQMWLQPAPTVQTSLRW